HRKRRGHSDRIALAWSQRRRCACNENLRAPAPRAQHRTSAARDVRASHNEAVGRDCIPSNGITLAASAATRKRILFLNEGRGTGVTPYPPKTRWLFDINSSKIFA